MVKVSDIALPDGMSLKDVNADVLMALDIITMQHDNKTNQEIAEAMGWKHRNSIWYNVKRLRKNGAFEKAESIYMAHHTLAAQIANQKIVMKWPELVDKVLGIALSARNGKTQLEAIQWLKEQFVDVALNAEVSPGALEQAYASAAEQESPFVIPGVKVEESVTVTG